MSAFSMCEMIMIRLWLNFKKQKCRDTIKIEFIQLILESRKSVLNKTLMWIKLILFQVQFGAYLCCLLMYIIEYIHSNHPMKLLRFLLMLSCHLNTARIGIHHLYIVMVSTFAGLSVLIDEINGIKIIFKTSSTEISTCHLIKKYLHYIRSVAKMNSFTKYLLLTSDLFSIPFMSLTLRLIPIPINGPIFNILRIIIVSTVVTYSCRVYILTAIFSRVDAESKRVYSEISSAIARKKVKNYNKFQLLLPILEDLASERSHFVIREYNSKVTKIVTFNNIVKTLGIAALYFSFQELTEKLVSFY